ncbi:MAG: STAS domain-containing protein [Bacilli bacterium]|nr:STAS domain-containing protein [Bacilli bacterium]
MEIKIEHGENLVISLKGRLDTVTSVELGEKLEKEEMNEKLVIMDMKELEYISSAGLRLLLTLKKKLSPEGKELEIHNLNPVCQEVFRVTGFGNILTVK